MSDGVHAKRSPFALTTSMRGPLSLWGRFLFTKVNCSAEYPIWNFSMSLSGSDLGLSSILTSRSARNTSAAFFESFLRERLLLSQATVASRSPLMEPTAFLSVKNFIVKNLVHITAENSLMVFLPKMML
ncbi:uncharacterized protein DS421_2g46860 [Arachis hypogaea]|nr:uncharacterized protein DS421_2g46860 [Arachis hypogaea]